MDNCNSVSTLIDPNSLLEAAPPGYTALKEHQLEYQGAIRLVMYAMLRTRPDLAFTVSMLSKYCLNPTLKYVIAALRVLRYLQKTLRVGITFRGQSNLAIADVTDNLSTRITGFTDSNWAGNKDTCKSTSGYLFMLYRGVISWKSARQSVVATSSTEAEYIACSDAAKEALWIRRLSAELKGTLILVLPDRY
jgi:hypothetical protein